MTNKERYAAWKKDVVKTLSKTNTPWQEVETPEMTLLARRLIDIPPCSWLTMEGAINKIRHVMEQFVEPHKAKRERFPAKPRWMKATSYDYFKRVKAMEADTIKLDIEKADPRLVKWLSKQFKVEGI